MGHSQYLNIICVVKILFCPLGALCIQGTSPFLVGTKKNTHTQGPRSKFSTGGAKGKRVNVSHLGGSGGLLPPENFDFKSSKMAGSAFKNNKRKV